MAFFTTARTFPCFIRSSPADTKPNNRNSASYLRNRYLGQLGQSLQSKLAIFYAVAIRLVICIMYVIKGFFYSFVKGVRLILLPEQSCIPAFVAGRKEPFADVVVCAFVYEKHVIACALFVYFL